MATNGFKVKNSINLQPGSAPANPLRGDIYCSSADGKFYRYDDGVPGWVELGSGGGAGNTVTVSQTGHGFATDGSYIGKPIRNSGVANTYVLAKADTAENAEVVGIITAVADANSFSYSTGGEITGLTGLTPNTVSFLSGDTAGSTTTTAPTTAGYIEKPLLIATASNKAIFVNMRGTTVGGTNLYTTIPLNNGTATTILNLSDDTMFPVGSCGELTGGECNILQTGVNTDYIFGFKVLWAKTASNVVNIQPDAMQDAPPGFAFGTSGANIQVSFTALANFESGKVRYAMNAAPVGAQLPLQIASSRITWSEPTMFRNRIINGGFDIWQRGTPQTSSGYGSSDRWNNQNTGSTKTTSQQVVTLGDAVIGQFKYFSRTVVSSVAGAPNYCLMYQPIEGVRTLAGQTVTVSFWAKADAAKNIAVDLYQEFGTGGSQSAAVFITPTTFSLTTSWQRYSVTVSIPSISGKTLGTNSNDNLSLVFWFDAGSSYNARTNSLGQQSGTFDITGVQLEPGTIATPFEFRPYGTELALCQRYLPVINYNTNGGDRFLGISTSTTNSNTVINFPVQPRTAPTGITLSSAAHWSWANRATGAGGTSTNVTFQSAGFSTAELAVTTTAGSPTLAAGNVGVLYPSSAGAYILFTGCEL